jgi:CheY-like chemotaxis protein
MEFAQSAPAALQRIGDAQGVSLILILSDINMPGMTGLELLPKAKAMRPDVPVIMITAYGDEDTKRSTSNLQLSTSRWPITPSIGGKADIGSTL